MSTEKTMKDSLGNEVPVRYVKPLDRARDRLVRRLHAKARKHSAGLAAFRKECLAEISAFQALAQAEYGVELGGEKGGVVLSSFDGSIKIERRNTETIAFDERLQMAQRLLAEWILAKSAGADQDLQKVVHSAFYASKEGLRTARILSLTKLAIRGEKWEQAMRLIRDSIQANVGRTHARFYERSQDGQFVFVPLDIAQVSDPHDETPATKS